MADANTRPNFFLPFKGGTRVQVMSYVGHNPDDKKMDMYPDGWPPVVASAPGLVHEAFEPGGIEIRHFIPGTRELGNWFTTYMHMWDRASVGLHVNQGDWVGVAGDVGTGVRHLHHEQLHDPRGDGNAGNQDIVYPAFVEYHSNQPFAVPVGGNGIFIVSRNGQGAPLPAPAPAPVPAMEAGMFEIIQVQGGSVRYAWNPNGLWYGFTSSAAGEAARHSRLCVGNTVRTVTQAEFDFLKGFSQAGEK